MYVAVSDKSQNPDAITWHAYFRAYNKSQNIIIGAYKLGNLNLEMAVVMICRM